MRRLVVLLLLLTLALFAALWFLLGDSAQKVEPSASQNETKKTDTPEKPKPKTLKEFTGEEFKQLAQSIKYPNVQFFEEPPPITGNQAADERIRAIAEARGYVLTSIPVSAIQKIDEKYLMGDDLLQPLAAIGWENLKRMAANDNIPLSMTSAYRSPAYQRDLFMEFLNANGVTAAQVEAGVGEVAVIATLKRAALPGYSRHHSGYTIDLWCDDGSGQFVASSCFSWMSADNYKKAKQAGWIPSYPDGAGIQGPEPEPWEYIWVGEDNLLE